jgi:FMN phosphatase YigB (HAD superfamily)
MASSKLPVSLVVSDLDNTVWDWVHIWHAGFSALVDALVSHGIDRETLLNQSRDLHQRHRTSEYSLLLEELPCLAQLEEGRRSEAVAAAATAMKVCRQRSLSLYPGVLETLGSLRSEGVLIVAYTESMAFHTAQRVRKLGLDGLLDFLYSSPDHDFPEDADPARFRKHPDDHYDLGTTIHRHVDRGVTKPNVGVLTKIIADVGGSREQTAYVGDSLMKDIAMAQDAGVHDVWAEYGKAQHTEEYELLRRVTHWSPEEVERERQLMSNRTVTPSFVLQDGISELLTSFRFSRFGEFE